MVVLINTTDKTKFQEQNIILIIPMSLVKAMVIHDLVQIVDTAFDFDQQMKIALLQGTGDVQSTMKLSEFLSFQSASKEEVKKDNKVSE